ncbi:hypothetical protein PACTADRAFT_50595 [Pachysolen tannophilus NRRL Y-2460]|uniref:EH domain-containing protein n=1 Tax=Pachysolen tannophilus NRRL Y-2460 TaxID=669874 RepID=A0A1E4TSK9_PACTA|nr:hypothetical protein PACTADRAFT_50595 [Pachysolen tannophilus NRRL Y-2460]
MSQSGFDWLNIPGISDSQNPNGTSNSPAPPPVSFGLNSSSSSINLPKSDNDGIQILKNNGDVGNNINDNNSGVGENISQIDFKNLFSDVRNNGNNGGAVELNKSNGLSSSERKEPLDVNQDNKLNQVQISEQELKLKKQKEDEELVKNFKDDPSIPLSLTIEQLSATEAKTYLRWYNDIITRRGTRTIKIDDVFNFLNNFKLSDQIKKILKKIFVQCQYSLNIGQFFCLLRLISHSIVDGKIPSRHLIKINSAVPRPVSILSRKRQSEDSDIEDDDTNDEYNDSNDNINGGLEKIGIKGARIAGETLSKNNGSVMMMSSESKLDLDNFAQFMLTGQRPNSPASSLQFGKEKNHSSSKKKKFTKKKVKFSDQVIVQPEINPALENQVQKEDLDFSLPMEQLLGRVPPNRGSTFKSNEEVENEEEELKDMQDSINHFRNVKIDSMSVHGVPSYAYHNTDIGNINPNPLPPSSPPLYQQQQQQQQQQQSFPFNNSNSNNNNGSSSSNQYIASVLSPDITGSDATTTAQPLPAAPALLQPNLTGSVSKSMRESKHLSPQPPVSRRDRSVSSPLAYEDASPQNLQNNYFGNVSSTVLNGAVSPPPLLSPPLAFPSLHHQHSHPIHPVAPPAPPPRARSSTLPQQRPPPPPPPSRSSRKPVSPPNSAPSLPPKIAITDQNYDINGRQLQSPPQPLQPPQQQAFGFDDYFQNGHVNSVHSTPAIQNSNSNSSDILGNLKALQAEVDRIKTITGKL